MRVHIDLEASRSYIKVHIDLEPPHSFVEFDTKTNTLVMFNRDHNVEQSLVLDPSALLTLGKVLVAAGNKKD